MKAKRFQRGFAVAFAIVLVGLIGASLAATMVAFAAEAKRTSMDLRHAQLRQLITAGTMFARDRLNMGNPGSAETIKLADVGEIQIKPASAGDNKTASPFEISATSGGRHMKQQATFTSRDGKWELNSVELR